MKYELWIDHIYQNTFDSQTKVGDAIRDWLIRHSATVKNSEVMQGKVNFEIHIL